MKFNTINKALCYMGLVLVMNSNLYAMNTSKHYKEDTELLVYPPELMNRDINPSDSNIEPDIKHQTNPMQSFPQNIGLPLPIFLPTGPTIQYNMHPLSAPIIKIDDQSIVTITNLPNILGNINSNISNICTKLDNITNQQEQLKYKQNDLQNEIKKLQYNIKTSNKAQIDKFTFKINKLDQKVQNICNKVNNNKDSIPETLNTIQNTLQNIKQPLEQSAKLNSSTKIDDMIKILNEMKTTLITENQSSEES